MPRQCGSSSLGVNLSRTGQCAEYPLYRDVSRTNTKEFMQQSGTPGQFQGSGRAWGNVSAAALAAVGDMLKVPIRHPCCIISDGSYEMGGFPGDSHSADSLSEWHEPHVKAWIARSWDRANVHPLLTVHFRVVTAC